MRFTYGFLVICASGNPAAHADETSSSRVDGVHDLVMDAMATETSHVQASQVKQTWETKPWVKAVQFNEVSNETKQLENEAEGGEEKANEQSGKVGAKGSQKISAAHESVGTTANLSQEDVHQRKIFFVSVAGFFVFLLLLLALLVVVKRHKAALSKESGGMAKEGGGVGYAPLKEVEEGVGVESHDRVQRKNESLTSGGIGMGGMSDSELKELMMEDGTTPLSEEERKTKIAEWAQKQAEKVRLKNEGYLRRRWWIIVFHFFAYVAASIGIPLAHVSEATCSRGFFWETHMQFFALFMLTKVTELWLCAMDETLIWEKQLSALLLTFFTKFLFSFPGYLDGYIDGTVVGIAFQCPEPLAQELSWWMGVVYAIGVVGLQWVVMFVLAARDPSHACLMKLVHMDLIAGTITLPPEFKNVWNYIHLSRTFGEDLPMGILQIIYTIKVKKNYFVIFSVMVGLASSAKALYDAVYRALEAAASATEFENREMNPCIYSCSDDETLRVWDIRSGECTKVIETGSSVYTIAVTQGMLYSSHAVTQGMLSSFVREWSIETGTSLRTFEHRGDYGMVVAGKDHIYTWARSDLDECVIKQWLLSSGECTNEFATSKPFSAFIVYFVRFPRLFASAPDDENDFAEWNIETGEGIRLFQGHSRELNGIFATLKRVFSASMDKTVREWSLETGDCTRIFNNNTTYVCSALYIVKDKLYNSADENTINEWSLETGKRLRVFEGHSQAVFCMTMLEDKLYSASEDKTIKEWSFE